MVLFVTFAIRYLLYRKLVFQPLQVIRGKAQAIANQEAQLGEQIKLPYGRELAELVMAFNTMSLQLRRNVDLLEERVKERTGELQEANEQLAKEIKDREATELEKEILIVQLKSALENIRTLKGLLPICASCKKVRNDQGYWEQIETYIRDRSDAEFSHSICPECRERLYPKKEDSSS
jgi:nitrate/nitrite-specific signal transduction histidine kinase